MSRDLALRFWLEYVSREGGLYEQREDSALAGTPPNQDGDHAYADNECRIQV